MVFVLPITWSLPGPILFVYWFWQLAYPMREGI